LQTTFQSVDEQNRNEIKKAMILCHAKCM